MPRPYPHEFRDDVVRVARNRDDGVAQPVTDAELVEAYRANALFDAHRDDPEFGYRFLVDEAGEAGLSMAARTGWRICSDNGCWSAFGKRKRGKDAKTGPPVHDELVGR
ncbi:transposase [Mycobacterium kansasii]|nr:transposase [Mycobacterium kansasii]